MAERYRPNTSLRANEHEHRDSPHGFRVDQNRNHKEGCSWFCRRPREDAIADMAVVIGELESLEASKRKHHPLLRTYMFHMYKIAGGKEWSVVSEICKLTIKRRTIPGEDPAAFLAEVISAIARARLFTKDKG